MTNKTQSFQDFLLNNSVEVNLPAFAVDLVLALVLSLLLSQIYKRFGESLSNRVSFSRNFVMITMTTMIIITIVKSSLALSLGLVGALSIVRFRTAIKEPEELAYMFLCIALGLGLGAGQRVLTLIGFAFMVPPIVLRGWIHQGFSRQGLYLTVSDKKSNKSEKMLEKVTSLLSKYCRYVNLRRLDESKGGYEMAFEVECPNVDSLMKLKTALRKESPSAEVMFIDIKGMSA